jgi:hypothetical protein
MTTAMTCLTVAPPGCGRPKGQPGKIIRLRGGLVQSLFRLRLEHACKDENASCAIAIRKQWNRDAQGYKPANSGAAREAPFVFQSKVLRLSANDLPSHAPPA